MKLNNFFSQQSKLSLEPQDKVLLFQKILYQHQHKKENKLRRFSYFSKIYSWVWLAMLLLVFVYIWFYKYSDVNYNFDNQKSQYMAQADNIWTIINAVWYFEITNGGRRIITDKIADQDIITLEEWSIMDIHISDSIYSQIKWPAKILVQFVGMVDGVRNYRLNMISGDYISIHWIVSDMNSDNVEVVTSDWTIIKQKGLNSNTNKEKNQTDFVLMKKNNKPIVLNKWNTNLELSNNKNNVKNEIKNESFAIISENTIKIVDTQSWSIDQYSWSLSSNPDDLLVMEITKIMNDDSTGQVATWWSVGNTWLAFYQKTWTKISATLVVSDDKKDLNNSISIDQVEQNLYASFVSYDIENIVTYYLLGQDSAYSISMSNLANRIDRISDALNIDKKYTRDAAWIMWQIDLIVPICRENNVDSNSLYNLVRIKNRLNKLSTYDFGYAKILSSWANKPVFQDVLDFASIKINSSLKIK